jgi:hypothetical protein
MAGTSPEGAVKASRTTVRASVRARSSTPAPRLEDRRDDSILATTVFRRGSGQRRAGASPQGSNGPGGRQTAGFDLPDAEHPGGRGAGTDGVSRSCTPGASALGRARAGGHANRAERAGLPAGAAGASPMVSGGGYPSNCSESEGGRTQQDAPGRNSLKHVRTRAAGFGPFHVARLGRVVQRVSGEHQEGSGRREAVRLLERRKL